MKKIFCFFIILLFSKFILSNEIRTSFINVHLKNVIPGKAFSLKKNSYPTLKILNKTKKDLILNIKVECYENPEINNFILIEKPKLKIKKESFSETDIIINLPERKEFYGKKFEVYIFTETENLDNKTNFSVGFKSKLIFETIKEK